MIQREHVHEAKRRVSHAIKALQGKSKHVDEVDWPPKFHHDHQIVFDIEDPRRGLDRLENPDAALLGRISEAEQLYFAATWLEKAYDGRQIKSHLGMPTDEHLRRIKHEMRPDAHEAIRSRVEENRSGTGSAILKDPATGIRHRVASHPFMSEDETSLMFEDHREKVPQFVLETLEKQIIHD